MRPYIISFCLESANNQMLMYLSGYFQSFYQVEIF